LLRFEKSQPLFGVDFWVQIVEDEDKAIRERRLPGLAIVFFAKDARVAQLQSQGSSGAEQERALIDTCSR
jgi:hypothetical protein